MNEQLFKERTRQLALKVIELVSELPPGKAGDILGRQILRSGTSVGANYRAACRSKSTADMIHKLSIVEEEGDETIYWLELLRESKIAPSAKLSWLLKETDELLAMTVASIKTLRGRKQAPGS
ncbi:MAG: four helix bundle protein [Verrucomicrobiales bacterium]|nr:four helix bundle protein [Verrucomicrobiales bacterium]